MALRARTPLLLLPQTYGEFRTKRSATVASRIVRDPLTISWSRDQRSHEVLLRLAGDKHNPARQVAGVDVAFGLQPIPRPDLIDLDLLDWMGHNRDRPVVGINVSGLLYNDPRSADRYGLTLDYRETVFRLVTRFLGESDARIVLVPHVNPQLDGIESDPRACEHLLERLTTAHPDRVRQAPMFTDPGSAKWFIGSLDWFMGSRMHSTIAALSSDVVAAALSYSMKTVGVFEACGMGSAAVNGRVVDTSAAVDQLWHLWLTRSTQAEVLARGSARTRAAAESQMDEIVSTIERCRAAVDD